jgi:hypothetical protein
MCRSLALLLVLLAPAAARAQVGWDDRVCASLVSQVFSDEKVQRVLGLYAFGGPLLVAQLPGGTFGLGVRHHGTLGLELAGAATAAGLSFGSISGRAVVARVGLGDDWREGLAPKAALILSANAGATLFPADIGAVPHAGGTLELLLWARLSIGLRAAVGFAGALPLPMFSLTAGLVSPKPYGW